MRTMRRCRVSVSVKVRRRRFCQCEGVAFLFEPGTQTLDSADMDLIGG